MVKCLEIKARIVALMSVVKHPDCHENGPLTCTYPYLKY